MFDLKIEYDRISYDCTDTQKPSVHEVIIADLLYESIEYFGEKIVLSRIHGFAKAHFIIDSTKSNGHV